MNEIHSNNQWNRTPTDDQGNGRKRVSWYVLHSSPSWPWHKKDNKKVQMSSLEDFEKKITYGR